LLENSPNYELDSKPTGYKLINIFNKIPLVIKYLSVSGAMMSQSEAG
jgi:hypothetical protein